jgi:hypothetical protein
VGAGAALAARKGATTTEIVVYQLHY